MNAPSLTALYTPFRSQVPPHRVISASELPEPYRQLLDHTNHMTVTVEAFYRDAVDVQVLDTRRQGDDYLRLIRLLTRSGGQVVQLGLVRIALDVLPEIVREEILAERTPLGRVLLQNNLLTRVEPKDFLRFTADAEMGSWLNVTAGRALYGRLGLIYAGERRAIEVLEILAPI